MTGINSRSRTESTGIKSTVRFCMYSVNRTPTHDSIFGEGMGLGEVK